MLLRHAESCCIRFRPKRWNGPPQRITRKRTEEPMQYRDVTFLHGGTEQIQQDSARLSKVVHHDPTR